MPHEEMAQKENHRQEFSVKCSQTVFKNTVRTPPSICFHSRGTKEFDIHKAINVIQPVPRLELRDHTISQEAEKASEEVSYSSMINTLDYLELENHVTMIKGIHDKAVRLHRGNTSPLLQTNSETIGSHS